MIGATLIALIILTPYMPVSQNTKSHADFIDRTNLANEQLLETEKKFRDRKDNSDEEIKRNLEKEQTSESKEVLTELIYSGRNEFQNKHEKDYQNSGIFQKIFGMGYGANYVVSPFMIERDFHDLFFQYGVLGTILIFIPFIIYAIKLLRIILFDFQKVLNVKYIMIISSILLALGIGFISGHTITAPAVSTYLALILAYLIADFYQENTINKKR